MRRVGASGLPIGVAETSSDSSLTSSSSVPFLARTVK